MTLQTIVQSETFLVLSRQDAYLQAHLQKLLDAQSEGLMAGMGAAPDDGTSSTGSRTPTTNALGSAREPSIMTRSVVPVRQPLPGKIGLRGARRGIAKTMYDLARLKDEEESVLQDEIAQRNVVLSDVHRISQKSTGLRRQIETIESESTNARISDLKRTEEGLNSEIHDLETRLYEMKTRQRHLLREIQSLESGVQSKLSSYKNALQLAEKKAREFLNRPALQATTGKPRGVWALPPQRRTLEMAEDQYREEQKILGRHTEEVMKEKEALDEGVTVWNEVTREVSGVENMVQEEMVRIRNSGDDVQARERMSKILERIDKARHLVKSHLDAAEARDWKLLVCSIGAELEALVEGGRVLQEALEASDLRPPSATGDEQLDHVQMDIPSASRMNVGSADRSEDEDDGPGPDLLVSQDDL